MYSYLACETSLLPLLAILTLVASNRHTTKLRVIINVSPFLKCNVLCACVQNVSTAEAQDLSRPHLRPMDLPTFELSSELEDWIWQDNMEFLRDKSMFDHTFFK